MRRFLRWIGMGLGGVLLLVLLFAVYVYAASSLAFRRTYSAQAHPPVVPTDSSAIAHGARMARILGCYGGCHGETGGGQLIDEPYFAVGSIPDLTRLVHDYDDVQLERVIRHGIKPNGRSVIEFMPSEMFAHLSDEDLGAVIAFLRSLPPADGPAGGIRFRPLARTMMAFGRIGFAAPAVRWASHPAPNRADPIELGRYLALTSCVECHGADLGGAGTPPLTTTPDLRIAAAYSPEQFTRLMRTGTALGERDVGLMSSVARDRFSHFTDEEIAALHAYLKKRAGEE